MNCQYEPKYKQQSKYCYTLYRLYIGIHTGGPSSPGLPRDPCIPCCPCGPESPSGPRGPCGPLNKGINAYQWTCFGR